MTKTPLYGIIGGMGTAAGLLFQNIFFNICHNRGINKDQDYPEWIYLNASKAPDRTAAVKGEGPSPAEYLTSAFRILDKAGVSAAVVTCNTAHTFYEEIYRQVSIPWIHLQNVTAEKMKSDGITKAGILATEGTIRAKLFYKALDKVGISAIEPQPESDLQARITKSIFDQSHGIKHTGSIISDESKELITEVIDELGTGIVVAGCTELSLALSDMNLPVKYYDPLVIAAEVLYELWTGERSIKSLG